MKPDAFLWTSYCVGAFFVGSFPFGYWLAKLRGVDLRTAGSGNIGATNVWRICGWRLGLTVFVLDVCKAYVPAVLGGSWLSESGFSSEAAILVGVCAVSGHLFSPFLGFRGGKGVASALGAVLAATPVVAISAFALWLVVFGLTRYVSLASIVGLISAPILAWSVGEPPLVWGIYSGAAGALIAKHRSNIARLLTGREYRFAPKKPLNDVSCHSEKSDEGK